MTKKHFIALAEHIRFNNTHEKVYSDEVIASLADFCGEQNSNFLRERWINFINGECGPSGGAIKKPKAVKSFGRSEFKVFKAVENA